MFKYLATAIVLSLASPAVAAVVYDDVTKSMTITGRTTNHQATKAYRIMKDNDVLIVTISGEGGDFYAGLRLGRLIDAEGSTVIIPAGKRAVSAAAFAALGADKLIVDGELWFHTPYLTQVPTGATVLETAQMFGRAYIDMTRYLASVGIPISFSHDLLVRSTPSKFVVIDDGAQIDRIRATETLWSTAIYEWRYAKSGG